MIRILLGGSPCTFWSIAQKNNRETEASGMGWELFKNYLIAKEKFKPHYFLYENNVSAAQPIKDQIKRELGVWDGTFLMPYSDVRYIEINSALVSAQNRERFYVHNCGEVQHPKDRGILLRDVLDSGLTDKDKAYCLKHQAGNARDYFKKHHTNIALEQIPVNVAKNGKSQTIKAQDVKTGRVNICCYTSTFGASGVATQTNGVAVPFTGEGKDKESIKRVYEVKDGKITIKGKEYPIKLPDGFYIIRKLTVAECCRLQTIPAWYTMPCSDTQNYKMLGNGWTVEVIKHILSHIPEIHGGGQPIEVLSMYDGMSCGQVALKELGANVVKYYATEIDKYAIQTTQVNFPNTIQLGDAFQVRNEDWSL